MCKRIALILLAQKEIMDGAIEFIMYANFGFFSDPSTSVRAAKFK